jgi:hypothetical protein
MDQPWPVPAVLESDAATAERLAPDFGLANLYSGFTCAQWPVPPSGHPHPILAPGSPPIVVVGSTGDPATPYGNAEALSRELDAGILLTRQGDGHTGYRSSACVRAQVDAYLLGLAVPRYGTVCSSP